MDEHKPTIKAADVMDGTVCINGDEFTFAEMSERFPGWTFVAHIDGAQHVIKPDAGQVETIQQHRMN